MFQKFVKLLEMVRQLIKTSKTQLSKIVQLGGVLRDIPNFGNISCSVAQKGTDIARNLRKIL